MKYVLNKKCFCETIWLDKISKYLDEFLGFKTCLSKLNFLGENYHMEGYTNLMVEVTFRPGLKEDLSKKDLEQAVINDLEKSNLVYRKDIDSIFTNTFKYAYVIYDKDHRKNTDKILNYLRSINIEPLGRFGTFEYINSDKAIELAKDMAISFKNEKT